MREEPVKPKYTSQLLTPPMIQGPHVCASYANLLACRKLHISLALKTCKKGQRKKSYVISQTETYHKEFILSNRKEWLHNYVRTNVLEWDDS
jgi:hypothetical protein